MKIKNLLALLVAFSTLTACGGGDDSPPAPEGFGYGKLTGPFDKDGVRPVSFSALYGTEVADSVCLPDVPSLAEFNAWADTKARQGSLANRKFVTSERGGVQSSIELNRQNKDLLDLLGALVFEYKNVTPYSGSMTPQKDKVIYSQIPSNCDTVACVGEAVFSDSYGARLYFKQNFGFLISEFADESRLASFKSNANLESVLFAIGTLPKNLLPLSKNDYYPSFQALSQNVIIAPYNRGERFNAGGAQTAAETYVGTINREFYADVNIYLYDIWQDSPDFYDRVYVLFHEFVHMYDKGGFYSRTDAWTKLSDWKVEGGYWKMGDRSKSCSYYGESSPTEDFAECGALYRFAPARLRDISPEKYEFFKAKIFKGVEFEATGTCAAQVSQFSGI